MGDNIVEKSNQPEDKDATVEHQFSAPWKASDLILVVEGQEFHVHKLILEMASPVFSRMFESDLKEKDAARVPLPGKKSPEFLDFLKLIYQTTGKGEITIENIDHIYALADEYQVEPLTKACGDFLKSTEKTEANAVRILTISEKYLKESDGKVAKDCLDALQALTISDLKKREGLQEILDKGLYPLFLSRIDKLENCMMDLYPQMFGLIVFLSKIWSKTDKRAIPRCWQHPWSDEVTHFVTMLNCDMCKSTLNFISHECRVGQYYDSLNRWKSYSYMFGDKPIADVLDKMLFLLNKK